MSYTRSQSHKVPITQQTYEEKQMLYDFEDNFVKINDQWDFLNGEPIIVKQYVPQQYLKADNKYDYVVNIYPSDPRYKIDFRYCNPVEVKEAYQFLKDNVYVGYFCDDEFGPCDVLCYVKKQFANKPNVLEYVNEIWPSSPERKFRFYPDVNEPQIKYCGGFH